jgi:hypothetical protein
MLERQNIRKGFFIGNSNSSRWRIWFRLASGCKKILETIVWDAKIME